MGKETVNRGILEVSLDLLADVMRLPPDHRIVSIERDWRTYKGMYSFIIEGPDLPETREGEKLMSIQAELPPMKLTW